MRASTESAGRSLSQYSQLGFSKSGNGVSPVKVSADRRVDNILQCVKSASVIKVKCDSKRPDLKTGTPLFRFQVLVPSLPWILLWRI